MELRTWLGIISAGLCAVHAQQPGIPAGGTQPRYGQRLNTVVQRAEGATNQPQPETYDPLSFYRKNPELMRRYFPHLFQAENAAPGTPAPAANNTTGRETMVLDSFRFRGGTAAELADMLKEHLNPPPNIIIAPKLRDNPVPEFELKNVTLADLFQALNNLSEDKSVQWQLSGSTEPIWVLNPAPGSNSTAAPQIGGGGFPGGAGFGGSGMMMDPITGAALPINNGRTCQILPLGKFLGEYKVEDITTAVKTAWGMMGDDAGAQLKYHTDTKLLIAVGTSAQLSILSQVLSSLETGMKSGPKEDETKIPKAAPSAKF